MAEQHHGEHSLKKGMLGVAGIVFFVVAASAPLVGMTGAVPVAILLGNGAAAPGAYLAVGLMLLIFSVGYATMSNKVTNAGAFFAYVGRGLGHKMGIASAFASIIGYVTVQLAIYGFFGGLLTGQVASATNNAINWPWYVWTLIAWALVTFLSSLGVDIGAKVLGTLMILELLSLIVAGSAMLINGGPEGIHIGASFNPANIFAGGFGGGAGIAIAFAFASFIGFEATAIYGEESKDPKRTVPRATYWAIGIITVLFAMVSFAMVTGMGASKVMDQVATLSSVDKTPLANPAGVLFALTDKYVGNWLTSIMEWLVVSSLFAGLLAFQNATSRYFFALGRAKVLPGSLGKANHRGAPQNGVIVTSAIALAAILFFWFGNFNPIAQMFTWMSGVTAIAIIFVEILVSLAVIVHFRRTGGGNVWKTTVAPAVAVVGLALGEYLLMSRFNLMAGTQSDGVDPTLPDSVWKMNTLGWVLVLSPFIGAVIGYVVAMFDKKANNSIADDVLS